MTCFEDPKNPIVIEANTASGAWAQVGKRINDLKEELTGKRIRSSSIILFISFHFLLPPSLSSLLSPSCFYFLYLTDVGMFTQLSGPEMFGFSHPTIAKLIQELPNAEMCDRYIFQEYIPSNISSLPPSLSLPLSSSHLFSLLTSSHPFSPRLISSLLLPSHFFSP